MSGLLKGLEATVLKLSEALKENDVWRIDASYFLKEDVRRLHHLMALDHVRIGEKCYVTDGIHTSIDFDEGSGIKVISAKHPKDGFLDLRLVEEISEKSHQANPRTALRANDVVLSTVGTIGNAAVVRPDALPANSDRHVAIIRTLATERPISPEYLSVFLNCSYGRMQAIRETTGNVQPNLFLVKVRDLKIARFSEVFESKVHTLSIRALGAQEDSTNAVNDGERVLLKALGLANWALPEPLAYTARAADAFTSGRFDAQYFMPAKELVRQSLASLPGQLLSERVQSIREQWMPDRAPPTMAVRNYDVTDALVPLLDAEKEPSLAAHIGSMKKVLKDGDVAISRLRAYLKEIAVVRTGDDIPSVGSSEFFVLRPQGTKISPETLMVFLRSAPVQTILKWCQDGSQHPRFSEGDLLSIPVPDAVAEVSIHVTKIVRDGFSARHRARKLLEIAKRAVEVAIESGEAAAMAYLDKAGGEI